MDLVSRRAAIDDINRALPDWSEDKEVAIDCLSNLPSVDAVPVVRCKDCKFYQFEGAFGMPFKMCKWFDFEDVDDDDFCSRGKRKEDADATPD